jgi:SAM-dependent methyltransferase
MDDEFFSYDGIADAYAAGIDDSPYRRFYEQPAMLALLPEVRGRRILDAGCGAGWYAERLLALGAHVTGVDASEKMLRHARARLGRFSKDSDPSLDLLVADLGEPLTFAADASFDGIVSPLVMHYLRDWSLAMGEFRRVLRPDGWLLFSTHHPGTEAARLQVERYFTVEQVADEWDGIGLVRFFRRPLQYITDALADAGFLIERVVEPVPTEGFRLQSPEKYERLLRAPEFILFLARPRPG